MPDFTAGTTEHPLRQPAKPLAGTDHCSEVEHVQRSHCQQKVCNSWLRSFRPAMLPRSIMDEA
jgi:hypothetical protein